jgi:chromosome segregation ATPase
VIEQAMYFALGFLVAALLALLFLPAFWRRAMRLSMRRLQMLAPMSMEEVVAERDMLRAEFAVRERRLEQEMEALEAARAEDMATTGRYAAKVAEAREWLKKAETLHRDMQTRLDEALKTVAERTELLRSTEMALHEMTERAERGVARLRLLEQDKQELGRETEVVQGRVAAHEARIGAMHEENIRLEQEIESLRETGARNATAAERAAALEEELAQLKADNADMTQALSRMDSVRQDLQQALDDARGEASVARRDFEAELSRLKSAFAATRAEASETANRLEAARADVAMLTGALEALRAEQTRRRATGLAASAGAGEPDPDLVALRENIAAFGDRVLAAEKTFERTDG